MPGLRISCDLHGLGPQSLRGGFFEGWSAPLEPAEHEAVLRRASHVALAWHGDLVVGFATALSDGVLCAYIPLLEVLPEYRGDGLGTGLISALLEQIGSLYMVDVMCDADVFPFYERLGFSRAGGGVIRNYGPRVVP